LRVPVAAAEIAQPAVYVTHTATCSIGVQPASPIDNTASVSAPAGVTDPTPANNSATDSNTARWISDMQVTKTANGTTVPAGGQIIYTITAFNAGPSPTTTTVSDPFPAGLTCTWTCNGTPISCPVASGSGNISAASALSAGASASFTANCNVSAALPPGTVLTNTASAPSMLGIDPTPGNSTATHTATVIAGGNLSITKTDGVGTVTAGGSTTYTIVARNGGPSTATGATVTDTFPAALTCNWTCAGAGGGTCTASSSGTIADTINLPANGTATYTAVCAIAGNASGSITNTATIAAPSGFTDSNPADNSATDVDGVGQAADLGIVKTSSGSTVYPFGVAVYTVVASNSGPSPATAVSVTDTLPPSLRSCSWSCTAAGGATCAATTTGIGNLADTINLPVGGTATYTAACLLTFTATGSLSNTATIASAIPDPNPANNSSTATDTLGFSADLSVVALDHVEIIAPGATLTYTIIAGNSGPSPANGASVTDTFPALCLSPTWTCIGTNGATCPPSGSGNIATTVDLPLLGVATFTATCTVDPAAPIGSVITNWATVMPPAGTLDPNTMHNSMGDSVTVTAGAAVSATKTVSGHLTSGGDATYTIVLSNGGGLQNDNPGDEFVDVLPPQLTLIAATASSGTVTADVAGNTVHWNGAIAAGANVTITIRTQISATATGAVSNQGMVSYDGNVDGTNESTMPTDDPTVGGAGNATVFGIQLVAPVPALGIAGTLLLALGLAGLALQRRRAGLL
ncbi:MAG TPA: DUF11 domain-containing protein, partial [Tahibacter sp.]|nr:DUF11 domain-containing protein [Tahibacter sp.]